MSPTWRLRDGRHSARLPGHDSSSAATYFVTICTYDRTCWFGEVINGACALTAAGEMVRQTRLNVPSRSPQVTLDHYVIMPKHVHGLVTMSAGPISLGNVVRAFKGASAHRIRAAGVENFGWHRNYHEHIVRKTQALTRIRQYIGDNPRTWENDIYHPVAPESGAI
jgi:REP element-mobilizing transposase RayT